jgi:PKD repeat protein
VSHQWSYGDGDTAIGQTPTHRYPGPATYTVTLTVTDEAGQSASTSQNVTIGSAVAPRATGQ